MDTNEDSYSSTSSTDTEEDNNGQYLLGVREAVLSVRRLVIQYSVRICMIYAVMFDIKTLKK